MGYVLKLVLAAFDEYFRQAEKHCHFHARVASLFVAKLKQEREAD
jgi:hypothetical protein